ncbi:MAG: glycoside hydrolase family 15 protein, partial [Acidimicrobiales bacterium]
MPTFAACDEIRRADGYAPLRDYAAIGDGRTVALVARDGSIDWLCLPDLDSPPVFAALLDARRGGRFVIAPVSPCETSRRYLPGTNVLETTFHTDGGAVRVTDAMTVPGKAMSPEREVVRVVEAEGAPVAMRWKVVPRFGYGTAKTRITTRAGVPVAVSGAHAIALCSWDAGVAVLSEESISGRFDATRQRAVFSLCSSYQEPLVLPSRLDVEERLVATTTLWRGWSGRLRTVRAWAGEVVRSALVLKLLVHAPSGAIAAAATTSLPEVMGGERNWDYRFCWVRDAAFVLGALLRLGCVEEADAFFWWLMQASQLT